jgi:hypothetical protein
MGATEHLTHAIGTYAMRQRGIHRFILDQHFGAPGADGLHQQVSVGGRNCEQDTTEGELCSALGKKPTTGHFISDKGIN